VENQLKEEKTLSTVATWGLPVQISLQPFLYWPFALTLLMVKQMNMEIMSTNVSSLKVVTVLARGNSPQWQCCPKQESGLLV
jgi:hypothetical protein